MALGFPCRCVSVHLHEAVKGVWQIDCSTIFVFPAFARTPICSGLITTGRKCFSVHGMADLSLLDIDNCASDANPSTGRQIIGELFLASYFKASYFGELFSCKLDY